MNVMRTSKQFILLLLGVLGSGLVMAQQAATPVTSQSVFQSVSEPAADSGDNEDVRVAVPSIVSIDGTPLVFLSDMERANYLSGGIGVGSSYDDNMFNQSHHTVGGYAITAQPHIALDFSTTRLQLKTQYSAGLTVNQRLSSQNQGAHGLAADFNYRLTPHVTVSLHDNFAITTGFFDQAQSDSGIPSNGFLQQSNGFVVTPVAKSTGNNGSAQLSYQFGAGSMVGVTAGSYISRYEDSGAGLLDTTGENFSGFYTHRISPRNWVGVRYGFQRLSFDPVGERSTTQSILYFHTIYLKKNVALSFFAGPEHTTLDGHSISTVVMLPYVLMISIPTENGMWTGSAGTSFSWQGQRTAVQAQFVRRVTDGGGLQGTVTLNGLSGGISRQLTPKTTLNVGASYAAMDPLSSNASIYQVTNSASARFGVERRFGEHVGMMFGYGREWQQSASPIAPAQINHNRGWITLSYDFSRPLGR